MQVRRPSTSPTLHDDRGDTTILVAGVVLVLFLAIGLVVDGGGLMRARDDARAAAEQAGRVAGQQVGLNSAMDGAGARVTPEQAGRMAADAARARGFAAEVEMVDGAVTITTRGTYRTVFWRMVGVRQVEVHGTASVRLVDSA